MSTHKFGDVEYKPVRVDGYSMALLQSETGDFLLCARCDDPLPEGMFEYRYGDRMQPNGPQHIDRCPKEVVAHQRFLDELEEQRVITRLRARGWTIEAPNNAQNAKSQVIQDLDEV
jgi:hypothetical protein